jgi:hypothetical protein
LARLPLEGTSLCIAAIRFVVGTALMQFGFRPVLLFELRSPMTAMQRLGSEVAAAAKPGNYHEAAIGQASIEPSM